MSKYNNQPVETDGYHFDSKMEERRYQELKLLEKAGEIRHLMVHPEFLLQERFIYKGKNVRAIIYEADFQYQEKPKTEDGWLWQWIVEDVKGHITSGFKIKQKMFWKIYPQLELRIVNG